MGGRVLRRRNQTQTAEAHSRATATGVLRPSTYPPERNENAATAASASANGTVFRALNVALSTRAVFTGVSIDGIILSSSSEGVETGADIGLLRSGYGHLRGQVVQVMGYTLCLEDVVEGG